MERKPEDIIGKPLVYWLAGSTKQRAAEGETPAEPTNLRESRKVSMVFSTDAPIRHWFGAVILDHSPEAMRLERLNSNGPYLSNHDWANKLGKIRQATTDGHQGTATAQITRNPNGEAFLNDFEDELETGTSVGFIIHKMAMEEETETDVTYRATDWEPFEISDAFVPADIGCNYIRELSFAPGKGFPLEMPPVERKPEAEPETRTAPIPPVQQPVESQPLIEVRTVAMENDNDNEIGNLGALLGETELARDFIAGNKTAAEFKLAVFEKRQAAQVPVPTEGKPIVDLTPKEAQRYSIARAILAAANLRSGIADSCMEIDVSQSARKELAARAPGYKDMGGVVIPTGVALRGSDYAMALQHRNLDGRLGAVDRRSLATERAMMLMLQRAGLDTLTDTAGQELVYTVEGTFIDMLRNRALVMELGASVYSGLVGNVSFPKQTGAGSFVWMAENSGSDVTDSALALDNVTLSPKTGMTKTAYSRQLLNQSNVNVDGIVLADIAKITALGIDRAALHGLGSSNQPKGLYAQSGVNGVAFGGGITFAKVVECETAVAAQNADLSTMAYLTTPEIRGKAKTTLEFSANGASAIWKNGEMNGYRAEATNQLSKVMTGSAVSGGSSHGFLFGVWSELLIGEWGAMEIITDPFTAAGQGMIKVIGFVMVDETVRYGEAFSKGTGLLNS